MDQPLCIENEGVRALASEIERKHAWTQRHESAQLFEGLNQGMFLGGCSLAMI